MSDWLRVCGVEELNLNKANVVAIEGLKVAVFRCADDTFYAVEDRCPHRGAPLSRGVIYQHNRVACLDHGWGICLATGRVEPPQTGAVRTFEVKVDNGVVWLKR